MTLYEILDLAASNFEKVDGLWDFFIWIHLGIIGGLIVIQRRLFILERIVALAAYYIFMVMNYSALMDTYNYLQVLTLEAAAFPLQEGEHGAQVVEYFQRFDLDAVIMGYLPYVHGAGIITVTVAVLIINLFATPAHKN